MVHKEPLPPGPEITWELEFYMAVQHLPVVSVLGAHNVDAKYWREAPAVTAGVDSQMVSTGAGGNRGTVGKPRSQVGR